VRTTASPLLMGGRDAVGSGAMSSTHGPAKSFADKNLRQAYDAVVATAVAITSG
jgi:hypothetical protein